MDKIVEVTDYQILFRISRLVDKGEFRVDYSADDFFRYLIREIEETKAVKVFAALSEKQIEGFIIVSVTRDLVRDVRQVFVDLAWVDKKTKNDPGPALLEAAEEFGRTLGIKEITGNAVKGEKSMLKKYGFDVYYTVFKKQIPEKKQEGKENVIRKTEERGDQAADLTRSGGSGRPVLSDQSA